MVAWSLLAFYLAVPFDYDAGLSAGLAVLILTWAVLAAAVVAIAVRRALAVAGAPRIAWCAVVVTQILSVPVAVVFSGEHVETEDSDAVCGRGLLPDAFADAVGAWLPWPEYFWAHLVAAGVGVGLLGSRATRPPAAWVFASLVMGMALAMAGFGMVVNHCD
jgi:hypothetical protein